MVKTFPIGTRLEPNEKDALDRAAEADERSVSFYMRKLIADGLRRGGWLQSAAKGRSGDTPAEPDTGGDEPMAESGATVVKTLRISESLAQRISDYHHRTRLPTETAAIRRLIEAGLRAEDKR